MARPIKVLSASEDVRLELRRRANGRSTEYRDRFRAKIILLRLDGMKIRCGWAHEHVDANGLDLVVAVREGGA